MVVVAVVVKQATRLARIATMQSIERAESHRPENLPAIAHQLLRAKNQQQACPRLKKCATRLA